eukprot:4632300-Pleurochrysis_carterae.AAC.5
MLRWAPQEREEAARLRRLRQAKSAALQRQQEHALKAAQTKVRRPDDAFGQLRGVGWLCPAQLVAELAAVREYGQTSGWLHVQVKRGIRMTDVFGE